jgi:hypothetical protein
MLVPHVLVLTVDETVLIRKLLVNRKVLTMGVYYPGDGTTQYYGEDAVERVRELREEARQHEEASDTYQRIGYKGHMVSEGLDARRKRAEADRIERRSR